MCSPSIRWCVDLNGSVGMPFESGTYAVSVKAVNFEIAQESYEGKRKPEIVHLLIQPNCGGSNLFLGPLALGFCIKTICMGGKGKHSEVFKVSDIEVYHVDFFSSPSYNFKMLDSAGFEVVLKGECVIDLVKL